MFEVAIQKMLAPVLAWKQEPTKPVKLNQAALSMREKLEKAPVGLESPRFFEKSLKKLLSEGAQSLNTRDDLVLSSRFLSKTDLLDGLSLAQREALGSSLIRRWADEVASPLIGPILWRAVFVAYFVLDDERQKAGYRKFLHQGLVQLQRQKNHPGWLKVVEAHNDVFGSFPSVRYVEEWLQGDSAALDALADQVDIPSSSWFWNDFVATALRCLPELGDTEFSRQGVRFVGLISRFPLYQDAILAGLVHRAAGSPEVPLAQDVLEKVIDLWGNPQLDLSDRSHRWSHVSDEARQWVCRCLAEEDLADFFELIKSSSKTLSAMDQRRFEYWKRFTARMQFTKLVLGPYFNQTTSVDISRFIKKRRDRLAWLNGSTPTNIAMLMKLGDHWFVEFAETGNACYGYNEKARPFNASERSMSLYQLKNKTTAAYRLSHMGPWEAEFDRTLSQIDIWPSFVQSAGRAPPKVYTNAPSATRDVERLVPSLAAHLARELSSARSGIVDNRNKGGSYWIELNAPPSDGLVAAMKVAGYRYASPRGFYR